MWASIAMAFVSSVTPLSDKSSNMARPFSAPLELKYSDTSRLFNDVQNPIEYILPVNVFEFSSPPTYTFKLLEFPKKAETFFPRAEDKISICIPTENICCI